MFQSREAYVADIRSFLLTYFREGQRYIGLNGTQPITDEELDLLNLAWIRTNPCRQLVARFATGSHLIRKEFRSTRTIGPSPRGRILAAASAVQQLVRGIQDTWVFEEQQRSENNVANDVLSFALHSILEQARKMRTAYDLDSISSSVREPLQAVLNQERKIQSFVGSREVRRHLPSKGAETLASRSRSALYHAAAQCVVLLRQLLDRNPEAINLVLDETIFSPAEEWRLFELWGALKIAEGLASRTGYRLRINAVLASFVGPIIEVGPFALYWQTSAPDSREKTLSEDEIKSRNILKYFGLSSGFDRPDIVITRDKRTIAIVEVKFFSDSTDWKAPFADAINQLVRYSRAYEQRDNVLGASCVLMAHCEAVTPAWAPSMPRRYTAEALGGDGAAHYAAVLASAP